jgi:large subunit ribosomal protein L25
MQRFDVEVQFRERGGKGVARQIRRAGRIPAVLYGEGKSTPLEVDPTVLLKVLHSESGENALMNLKILGGKGKESTATAILRDFQRDPVSGEILHADLFEVSMNKVLRVQIPLVEVGSAPGVKEGGVLQHNLREIEIECLPLLIPDHIEVDISALAIGDSVHVRDLRVAEGIKILEDEDQSVISVAAPISEAELETLLAGAPAEVESKEPEVVAKGKEKEEGEEGEPGAKGAEKAGGKAAEKPGAKPGAKAEGKS